MNYFTGKSPFGVQGLHVKEEDHIGFLADKYGVSRQTVLIAMSLAGTDKQLVEKILSANRFSR